MSFTLSAVILILSMSFMSTLTSFVPFMFGWIPDNLRRTFVTAVFTYVTYASVLALFAGKFAPPVTPEIPS